MQWKFSGKLTSINSAIGRRTEENNMESKNINPWVGREVLYLTDTIEMHIGTGCKSSTN